MQPSTFTTGSAPLTGRQPALAGYAPDGPVRTRVRALDFNLFVSYNAEELSGSEAGLPSGAYQLPPGFVEDFVLAHGQKLFVANVNAAAVRYSVACSDYWAQVPREQEPVMAAVRRKPLVLGVSPIQIAVAPHDRPCRLTIRNASAVGRDAGISEEITNLIQSPGRGYQTVAGAKDIFYLAPGQRLYAVASGNGDVVLSVEESDVVVYQGTVMF